MSEGQNTYQSAGLLIDTKAGEVSSLHTNHMVRLSPVNMRVLTVLIDHAEHATSRHQLFDLVWPNQTVSDDALTRCISDLRSQLKPLTNTHPLIDTIPKVGYRWLSMASKAKTIKSDAKAPQTKGNLIPKIQWFVAGLLLLIVLGWALLALIHWWSKPLSVALVILPTHTIEHTTQTDAPPAAINPNLVNVELKQAIAQYQDLQYLSQIAFQSHQGSPFPYFNHQFGVRWFIESQISHQQNGSLLTLNLVDAKTALVTYSMQKHIQSKDDITSLCQDFLHFIAHL